MVSSLTQAGALATFEALELGAVDYVAKPGGTVSRDIKKQAAEIVAKVKAAARARMRRGRPAALGPAAPVRAATARPAPAPAPGTLRVDYVIVGVSTGGPATLMEILPRLPADLGAPVVVVQHMPPQFTGPFAARLDQHCALRAREAAAGDVLEPGWIYVAPGGRHLKVARRLGGGLRVRLSEEPRVLYVPSVDVTIDSFIREVGPRRLMGVLLTGMGNDGAQGLARIRAGGGLTIAEAESTAVVWGMPGEAVRLGAAAVVAPAGEIADWIVRGVRGEWGD
jgi:two-component system chemotaxis response regulator CheB